MLISCQVTDNDYARDGLKVALVHLIGGLCHLNTLGTATSTWPSQVKKNPFPVSELRHID